jgi:hypothetical protein
MSKHLLIAALVLAYGPFLLMALLYLVGLVLRLSGRPGFLHLLIERTRIPQPVNREEVDRIC